ncbi:hypothetical protein [Rodentibacter caecimuris]|uniref:hypothetical protein n=1 Tax=Rodentibacter caecimuris TaxID=1796644 RepID=UPI000A54FEA0|nr:hypothetical protein [Rodentibacter heylii]
MIARIFKWLVIGVIALIVVAIWAGYRFFNGIDLGGTGHSPSTNIIEDYINKYQARKTKMEKMEQLQANLAFVCKHEDKPELSAETQQLYNYALYHDLHYLVWKQKSSLMPLFWEDRDKTKVKHSCCVVRDYGQDRSCYIERSPFFRL